MPDPYLISENSTPANNDPKAQEESKDLVSRFTKNRREQNAFHWAYIVFLWVVVVGLIFVVIVKIMHLLLPVNYCWLNDSQIQKINEFITTGGIGSVGTILFKNKIGSSAPSST